jgi:hypothetical protein
VGEWCRTVQVAAAATTTIAPTVSEISHRGRDPACCAGGADVGGDAALSARPRAPLNRRRLLAAAERINNAAFTRADLVELIWRAV